MLEHHKAVVVAATDQNLSRKAQQRTGTQGDTSTAIISNVVNSIDDQAQQYGESEPENGVDYADELLGASYVGDEGMVRLLLGLPNVKINSKDKLGRTPLSWAAENGHEAVVKLLLEKGAEVETKDTKYGRTPLSYAAERWHEVVVKLLREKGANLLQ